MGSLLPLFTFTTGLYFVNQLLFDELMNVRKSGTYTSMTTWHSILLALILV